MISVRRILKNAILSPLRIAPIRSRLSFWLSQEYFPELQIEVPLSEGLVCPIHSPEYWCSFSEIFLNGEYEEAFEGIPVPNRWIDLGCHAGFFSLYVEWLRRKHGAGGAAQCLLVDGDRRVGDAIARLNGVNKLSFNFLNSAIGAGQGAVTFVERGFMASSVSSPAESGGISLNVPICSADEMVRVLPGPYDVLKVDVEGGEYELLQHYGTLLRQARHLILEWHSWHGGGGGKAQLIAMAQSLGFELRSEIRPAHDVGGGRKCGVLLLENRACESTALAV